MVSSLGFYASLVIYCFTLAIEVISVFLVYRQRATTYPSVRTSLLGVYIISIAILFLELTRLFLVAPSATFMILYAGIGVTLVLLVVVLLTLSALGIYLRLKQGGSFDDLFQDILSRKRETAIFFSFLAYVIDFFEPCRVVIATVIFEGPIPSVTYEPITIGLLAGVLLFFMIYPSPLFFLAARKIPNDQVRRNLTILPICYIGIGIDLLIVEG